MTTRRTRPFPQVGDIEIIDRLGDDDEILPFEYKITSYGADYPVELLVNQLESGDLYTPDFQRSYVWSVQMASRFVESLLLGLPVPGIFISKEPETETHLIIDGQQRLKTLQYFFKGLFPPLDRGFSLVGVQTRFKGITYDDLMPVDRRRLNNSILHTTIIRQDDPAEDKSSIYHIFERLNSGGKQLAPQEIRSALFHGELVQLLKQINDHPAWRELYGPKSQQLRDQELIVRFLAFFYYLDSYQAPMKTFLNRYMGRNRNLKYQSAEEIRQAFISTITLILSAIGPRAFKPERALNAAVFDSLTVGLAKRLQQGPISDVQGLKQRHISLLEDKDFQEGSIRATANEQRVTQRFNAAITAFRDLQ
jgi:hypothetical protein